jgi:hypothetical protein
VEFSEDRITTSYFNKTISNKMLVLIQSTIPNYTHIFLMALTCLISFTLNLDTHVSWTMIFIDAKLLILHCVLVAGAKTQFFFNCSKYSNSRYKLMDNLLRLNNLINLDTHLLLWSNNALPTEVNNCIFWHAQTYIY